ncbi:uroporphyrinogen-III synthase [Aestuariivita sp.]|jgi:uroporphyrinogen-III synthase|uniref:uroporphyrinogen-III synthase n=1 Tax=Aestuariivita sp. TaxID=1872407 RepID=UPI00216FDB6B|nr:uroporphyrinogen-III synthase [Aestuariivita sp.]MCE8005560.1 uroporphyrinogen-III synthase [Aestuariivita sp.]
MTLTRPTLLLTRPEDAARRFLGQLDPALVAQSAVCISPLIRIVPRTDPVETGTARGLIFTSANAVRAAEHVFIGRDLPAYCVGGATASAARQAGWIAHQIGPDADALVVGLIRERPDGPLVHLRGRHARGDIAQRLTACDLPTREHVIYDQIALPLSSEALRFLDNPGPKIAPVFSPRTACLLADATDRPLVLAALSPAVAGAFGDRPGCTIHIAASPDARSMGALVEKLMQSALSG